MNLFTVSLVLLSVPLAGFAYLTVRYYRVLPDRMASHFGITGMPDAYMTKKRFFILSLAMVALSAMLLAGSAIAMAVVVGDSPNPPINLIHREYWLAPGRRESTATFISAWLSWLGTGVLLLMLDIFRQALQINLGQKTRMRFRGLLAFLLFMFVWVAAVFVRFGRV